MSINIDYHPCQGSVEHKDLYFTYTPFEPLNQWVQSFWQLTVPEGTYYYRSVPDNCVDLIIDLTFLEEPFIVTPFTSAKVFEIVGPISYFGIRFNILGHHGLFSSPLGEWKTSENITPSDGVLPNEILCAARDYVGSKLDFQSHCSFFEKILLDHLKYTEIDTRLIKFICYSYANTRASADFSDKKCSEFGISARQLRRLSHLYLGLSPKNFYKILRFQMSLKAMRDRKIASVWEGGYHDQSHFIRNFKSLVGVTPTKFVDSSVLYNTSKSKQKIIAP